MAVGRVGRRITLEAAIRIRHLSYTYPDGKQALEDINLQVIPGEKIALLGANGAGKSTLLGHLNGVLTGQGDIEVAGLALNQRSLGRIRSLVGMVFQNPDDQLFSPTVFDDVAYGPIYQGLDPAEVAEKVAGALRAVGLSDYSARNPYHLSGGEKKRVAIATVLSMDPHILVFDEPSSGLDPRARRELIELLRQLPQTLLIATHDLDLAAQLASRAVLLDRGRIVADGPCSKILCDEDLLWRHGMR
jgi:cobalt/nickel transport system ATP-binding protein